MGEEEMTHVLGIELGSTRIKAVLIDETYATVASGAHDWENRFENGVWTYHLDDVWVGIQDAYRELIYDAKKSGISPNIASIGISAMMHGYLVFDRNNQQLVPFRTWRNTMTEQAASLLTEAFSFNIPQRWSIAHLYQSVLNREDHIQNIDFITTLSGYVHWKLTDEKVLGIGEASGMFPIDSESLAFCTRMINQFDELNESERVGWKLNDILPKVLLAGNRAGVLSEKGSKLIDPSGLLRTGIPLCPPEGDAGTGMVATNSIAERTGNVSAGTSIFAMIVLEKGLSDLHKEIDMVTTPAGKPVAMVHCNNCTSDLDAWIKLFEEIIEALRLDIDRTTLYRILYNKALEGEADGGGLLSYNYLSGEHLTGFEQGRPLLVRSPESKFTLPNLMRTNIFSSLATLRLGMEILTNKENVHIDQLLGHGGLFKTKGVGQRFLAAAIGVPVTVMESAGEGGAWGIALLASYMLNGSDSMSLENYLSEQIFAKMVGTRVEPIKEDIDGFNTFIKRYKRGLPIERAAIENMQ